MRKMSKFNPKELQYAFYGESNRKGIYMRLEKSEESVTEDTIDFTAVRFPGSYACITKDGTVKTTHNEAQEIWDEEQEKAKSDGAICRKMKTVFQVLSLICIIGLFVTAFINEYLPSLCVSLYWICFGLSFITQVVLVNWRILRGDDETKQLFRFHAAEHAAINAYYDLKRVPTMEEIKEYSNFSYDCGVIRLVRPAWIAIGIGLCRLAPGLWFLVLLPVFILLTCWVNKRNFYFTEVIYLAEPTEFEYDVAITAMTEAVSAKEKIEKLHSDAFKNLEMIRFLLEVYELENGSERPMFRIQVGNPDDLEDE